MQSTGSSGQKKRVLWLHTQPEHYFNCMMDDLAREQGYRAPGMEEEQGRGGAGELEFIAAFQYRGPGLYTENAQPAAAKTMVLRACPGLEGRPPRFYERYHANWKSELYPLEFATAIVSGYASRTAREVISDCRKRGIPVAVWSDSNLRSQRGRSLGARLRRRLKKAWLHDIIADTNLMLTANSLGVAYWRYYGMPRERIVLCPCYTDYRRIDAARQRNRAEVMARIGLAETDRLLFTAARLVEAKGLDLMIRAFITSGLGNRGWKYVIAGVGALEAELRVLAGDSAGRSVLFVGFQQPTENLALMAHAQMLAVPSRYEPHGIVVGESLAAGTPVLSSNVVGATRDLVRDGDNGLIFRSDDEVDLRRKLALLTDEVELQRMRAAARPAFEAWYRKTSPMLVVPRAVRKMLEGVGGTGGARR